MSLIISLPSRWGDNCWGRKQKTVVPSEDLNLLVRSCDLYDLIFLLSKQRNSACPGLLQSNFWTIPKEDMCHKSPQPRVT